jgi:hypothetical protein
MVKKKVGRLLHGGDLAGDGRRRRSGPVSSEFLTLGAEFDLRWVGESGGLERSSPTRYLKSNSEAVVPVAKAVVPLPGT